MNLVNECPQISDNWRGGLMATARTLGIDRKTLDKYAKLGRHFGGIDSKPGKNGKRIFSGREIKRFWREFI